MKHTHVGHCQACGRLQASEIRSEGFIAKHGYNVDFGYFSGTCSGSGKAPLEIARDWCDEVIASSLRAALSHEESATQLQVGAKTPTRCENGSKCIRPGKWETIWLAWADAGPYLRCQQVERETNEHLRHAQFLRSHAERLTKLAASVHGQPMRRVERLPPLVVVGGKFTVTGNIQAKAEEYEITATGVPGGIGGRAIYTLVKRTSDGKVLKWPTAAVRRHRGYSA